MGKPKLHEVLAVEADLEGQYKRVVDEATQVFKKGEHFVGSTRTLTMFDAARKHEEAAQREHKELTTTVPKKLRYAQDAVVRYLDVVAKKEVTNQMAVADLELDGKVLIANAPATLLLGLETKLKAIRGMYEAIPTLAPGIRWVRDTTQEDDVWVTEQPETAMKTEKIIKPFVLYEATDKHPAQVRELTDNVNVGMYEKHFKVGVLSPKEKSELIGRIDTLIRAVKKARQRANMTEVPDVKVGGIIMGFINEGKVE